MMEVRLSGVVIYEIPCHICGSVYISRYHVHPGYELPHFDLGVMRRIPGVGNVCDKHKLELIVDGTDKRIAL